MVANGWRFPREPFIHNLVVLRMFTDVWVGGSRLHLLVVRWLVGWFVGWLVGWLDPQLTPN